MPGQHKNTIKWIKISLNLSFLLRVSLIQNFDLFGKNLFLLVGPPRLNFLNRFFDDSYPDLWSEVSQRDALFPQSAGCFSSDFGSVGFRFLYWSAPPPPDIMLSSLQPLLEPGFFNHLNQPERGNDTPLKFINHFFRSNIWIQE